MISSKTHLIIVTLFLSCLVIPSCENQEDPPYIGTWQHKEQVNSDGQLYNTTRTLILTRNTYEETYLISRENSGLISGIFGTRGKLAFSRYYMVFKLEELGTCARGQFDTCTEEVEWFGEGTQYWTNNLPFYKMTIKGEYKADELTLHLKRDINDDHDLDDTGEDIEFERI